MGERVAPGTHFNIIGSSIPGTAEIDSDLIVRSSFFVDYRELTFNQASEYDPITEAQIIWRSIVKAADFAIEGQAFVIGRDGTRGGWLHGADYGTAMRAFIDAVLAGQPSCEIQPTVNHAASAGQIASDLSLLAR